MSPFLIGLALHVDVLRASSRAPPLRALGRQSFRELFIKIKTASVDEICKLFVDVNTVDVNCTDNGQKKGQSPRVIQYIQTESYGRRPLKWPSSIKQPDTPEDSWRAT